MVVIDKLLVDKLVKKFLDFSGTPTVFTPFTSGNEKYKIMKVNIRRGLAESVVTMWILSKCFPSNSR
jgi:hypothetical protein